MAESLFNQENLDFRFFPKNALISESMINQYNTIPTVKKKLNMFKLLYDGLRMTDADDGTFVCVICDLKFADFDEISEHINLKHQEPGNLLRETAIKPVVGMETIFEYRNDNGEIVEYECSTCKLFLHPKTIFWHIISYPHKEEFFKATYADDPVNKVEDEVSRHKQIDQALIEHEKKHRREQFRTRHFQPGMIPSSSYQSKLNMSYIRKLFPTESAKLELIYQKEEQLINPLRSNLEINIENQEQFLQGKEILQKMNKALLEYLE